jgi:hypothetical protein
MTKTLPMPESLEYMTQKMLHAFVEAHCRCRRYDKLGHDIKGGTVLANEQTVCASHAINFAQALRDEALAEGFDLVTTALRFAINGFDEIHKGDVSPPIALATIETRLRAALAAGDITP